LAPKAKLSEWHQDDVLDAPYLRPVGVSLSAPTVIPPNKVLDIGVIVSPGSRRLTAEISFEKQAAQQARLQVPHSYNQFAAGDDYYELSIDKLYTLYFNIHSVCKYEATLSP
jgi:hypothetical protein